MLVIMTIRNGGINDGWKVIRTWSKISSSSLHYIPQHSGTHSRQLARLFLYSWHCCRTKISSFYWKPENCLSCINDWITIDFEMLSANSWVRCWEKSLNNVNLGVGSHCLQEMTMSTISLSLRVEKIIQQHHTVSWFAFFYQEWHFSFSSKFRRRYF